MQLVGTARLSILVGIRSAIALVLLAGLTLAVTAQAAPLSDLYERYWQEALKLDPDRAAQLGERTAFGAFNPTLESAWREQMLAHLTRYQDEVDQISLDGLSPEDRRSLSILRDSLAEQRRFYAGPAFVTARRLPIDQFQGPHLGYAQDAAGSGAVPFRTVEDYDLALSRADAYARWTDNAIERLQEGVRVGVVLPRLVVERILPQLTVHLHDRPEDTEFWQPVRAMPAEFPAEQRERLEQAYREKIRTVIVPAYQRLHDYLKQEYLPHARASVGLGGVRGGSELYRYLVRRHTTTDLTPAQIHTLGKQEVQRIGKEMDRVQRMVGFKGSRAAFFDYIRHNPALHFDRPEQIVPDFEAHTARIVPLLPTLFGTLPKARYEIHALPADSSHAFQGNGDYAAPAADGSRPGILWINIYASGVQDRYNVMTLCLHEGLPGHHFQAAIALEHADLPAFRRSGNFTAYVEGWGLYAESLGRDMGLFSDPWDYFGHLNYAMLRANRLVIDTGLHAYGWSVEDGVRYMTAHSSMTEEQARAEVERYVAYPGQALAYKVGELKIRALRHEAQARLGARFDLRRFHDRVLQGGPVPLTDLQDDIRAFIRSEASRVGASVAQPITAQASTP